MTTIGRYRIVGKLGEGGMGKVFLAEDPALGRRVAIKVLSEQGADASQAQWLRARFLQEARVVALLNHPSIVSVYDIGEENDTAYIVMEYVPGPSLAALSRARRIEWPELVRIIREIAAGLDYAHGKEVIHRDIKPANLLMQLDGAVKIADFGIAKLANSTHKTSTGMVMGTLDYMAPEQLVGRSVSPRSDQYALAALAYAVLTGKPLFEAESFAALAYRICHEPPPQPELLCPDLPVAVGHTLKVALAKDPADRYPTCSAFAAAFEASFAPDSAAETLLVPAPAGLASPADVPTVLSPQPATATNSRRGWLIAGGAALVAGLAATATFRSASTPIVKPTPPGTDEARANPPAAPSSKPQAEHPNTAPSVSAARTPSRKLTVAAATPTAVEGRPSRLESATHATPSKTATEVPATASDGRLVWTGELESGQEIDLGGPSAAGAVSGSLPGVPVAVEVHPSSVRVVHPPGPQNGWRHLVLHNDGQKQVFILVRWSALPRQQKQP